MSYTKWLRHQVALLEGEIRRDSIFDDVRPATPEQLQELRSKIVIHTYMKQQLLRRETLQEDGEYDTREIELSIAG